MPRIALSFREELHAIEAVLAGQALRYAVTSWLLTILPLEPWLKRSISRSLATDTIRFMPPIIPAEQLLKFSSNGSPPNSQKRDIQPLQCRPPVGTNRVKACWIYFRVCTGAAAAERAAEPLMIREPWPIKSRKKFLNRCGAKAVWRVVF